jgi:hypothetical protein
MSVARPVGGGEAPSGRAATRILDRRFEMAEPDVFALIDAVRCWDRPRVEYLTQIVDVPIALVMLAAMVPQNTSPKRLLAWTNHPPKFTRRKRPTPQPLNLPAEVREAHRAFNAHKVAGTIPSEETRAGEREYQRLRSIQRRARQAST